MKFKAGQLLIDKIRNKKNTETDFENNKISLSNNTEYPQFCLNASLNEEIFRHFKQNPIYQEILEHVDQKLGQKYIDEIKKIDASLLKQELIDKFKQNDNVGDATFYDFEEVKHISGSTLRYIHVLAQIKKIFGSLNNKTIGEIGIGYGGQCRILSSFYKIKSYTLIDLKQVLGLAQKYLDNYPLETVVSFKTMNELPYDKQYDFVISNYAFSEISRDFQEIYMEKVIKKSKQGFMIMNQVSPNKFNSLQKEELLSLIPNNPRILEEIPLTHPDNYIIVWGENI